MRNRKRPPQTSTNSQGYAPRQEAQWPRVAKRLALFSFITLMCVRIGLSFSIYEQSREEVAVKEEKLADLSAEQARVGRQLKCLDTPDGREIEAYEQGWIPPGCRLLLLPQADARGNAAPGPWASQEPTRRPLQKLAGETSDLFLTCQEKMASWWRHPRSNE